MIDRNVESVQLKNLAKKTLINIIKKNKALSTIQFKAIISEIVSDTHKEIFVSHLREIITKERDKQIDIDLDVFYLYKSLVNITKVWPRNLKNEQGIFYNYLDPIMYDDITLRKRICLSNGYQYDINNLMTAIKHQENYAHFWCCPMTQEVLSDFDIDLIVNKCRKNNISYQAPPSDYFTNAKVVTFALVLMLTVLTVGISLGVIMGVGIALLGASITLFVMTGLLFCGQKLSNRSERLARLQNISEDNIIPPLVQPVVRPHIAAPNVMPIARLDANPIEVKHEDKPKSEVKLIEVKSVEEGAQVEGAMAHPLENEMAILNSPLIDYQNTLEKILSYFKNKNGHDEKIIYADLLFLKQAVNPHNHRVTNLERVMNSVQLNLPRVKQRIEILTKDKVNHDSKSCIEDLARLITNNDKLKDYLRKSTKHYPENEEVSSQKIR